MDLKRVHGKEVEPAADSRMEEFEHKQAVAAAEATGKSGFGCETGWACFLGPVAVENLLFESDEAVE